MDHIEMNENLKDDSLEPKKTSEDSAKPTEKETGTPVDKGESTSAEESPKKPLESEDASAEKSIDAEEASAEEPIEAASDVDHDKDPSQGDDLQEEAAAEQEKVNFSLLSKEDLVKVLEEMMDKHPFEKIRTSLEDIYQVFDEKVEQENSERKAKFIEEGGLDEEFTPPPDPVVDKMQVLLQKFRALKADFNKQQEADKEKNLARKQAILEELRVLMEGQQSFEATFRSFKKLQNEWFDIGIVPKQNVRDLWNSYNFFVDQFNDYVKINHELRAMDFKKNMELKEALCEKAEALDKEENISTAFKTLQKYHAQWRDIGPVPREHKDTLWERFKAATSVINKKHQEFQNELKKSLVVNLEKKVALCEKAEEIAALKPAKHSEWSGLTKKLLDLQKAWKSIGYAPKKDNNQIYARFRKACDIFFEAKAAFYAETFEEQKENLEKKRAIVEEAEALKGSAEWKETSDKLIKLQKQWKEIGPVPRKDSDRLWKRFRAACDHFFNSRSDHQHGRDGSFEENLQKKEELIKRMNEYSPEQGIQTVISDLENFQREYNGVGFVPSEKKDEIRDSYKDAQTKIIDAIDASDEEKNLIRFRMKMASLLDNPRGENKLRTERDRLAVKLSQLENDISVWENNIGFFKQTKSSEGTIGEFQVKIDEARSRIDAMRKKIRIIDRIDETF